MRSKIEALVGRELDREVRAGVDHFVPGQLAVRRPADVSVELDGAELAHGLYEVSFVNPMGHARLVFVVWDDDFDGWLPIGQLEGGQTSVRERPTPTRSGMHPDWVAALDKLRAQQVTL